MKRQKQLLLKKHIIRWQALRSTYTLDYSCKNSKKKIIQLNMTMSLHCLCTHKICALHVAVFVRCGSYDAVKRMKKKIPKNRTIFLLIVLPWTFFYTFYLSTDQQLRTVLKTDKFQLLYAILHQQKKNIFANVAHIAFLISCLLHLTHK